MSPRNVILLGGARNNCGDYLIVARAQALFKHYLPGATVTVLDRTRPFDEAGFTQMTSADLVVLAGGPLIRGNCAESLNLAEIALSGRLQRMRAHFVIMGGGGKLPEPFTPGRIKLTEATRILFDKIEASPFYSGTRDFESLILLRNAGYGNFRFTGCPALYSLDDCECTTVPFALGKVRTVVFSCGAPGGMCPDAIEQHMAVLGNLRQLMPKSKVVAAFHHSTDPGEYAATYGGACPSGWMSLRRQIEGVGIECDDISGGLERMLELYSAADLHVGYRVHAHVLMTSWRKPSVLIAEDGRGSGMADVITGKVFRAWHHEVRRRLPLPSAWCPPRFIAKRHLYDMKVGAEVASYISGMDGRTINAAKTDVFAMAAWFAQFTEAQK